MLNKSFLLTALLTLLTTTTLYSQSVDSVMLNGEQVYVYPFKMTFHESYYYRNGFNKDEYLLFNLSYDDYIREQRLTNASESETLTEEEFNDFVKAISSNSYRKLSKYWSPKMGPKPSKYEFRAFVKFRKQSNIYAESKSYVDKKKFKKAIRENPYPFILQNVYIDQDITPMLDPIPDGKYIQYYESYRMLKENGDCEWIKDQVAGYFTMKNNTLEGEAIWIGLKGDTLKHGFYEGGLKTGTWTHISKSLRYFDDYSARMFVKTGYIYIDTAITYTTFKNGVENGDYSYYGADRKLISTGSYEDGEESGEWNFYYLYSYRSDSVEIESPLRAHYILNDDDSLIVHPVVVRSDLVNIWSYNVEKYNLYPEYYIPEIPEIYLPAFPKEENLDLTEESESDYYDEYDEMYYDEMYYEEGYYGEEYYGEDEYQYGYQNSRGASVYDPVDKKYKLRTLIYDSLGAYPIYQDVYEAYYPNGQLVYRYEFENGNLVKEPTVYWENGEVHDEVVFNADSNQYQRFIYDYEGTRMESMTYDSLGNFLYRDSMVKFNGYYSSDLIELEGFKFYNYGYRNYEYEIPDSVLELGLTGPTIYEKVWLATDSTVIHVRTFFPETMTSETEIFNVLGGTIEELNVTYSDDYDSWTGTGTRHLGPYELRSIRSASLSDFYEKDSIPIRMLTRPYMFDIENDYTLYYEGNPLTGPMKIKLTSSKMQFGKTQVSLPINNPKANEKLVEEVDKYKAKGKISNKILLENLPNQSGYYEGYQAFFFSVFSPLTSYQFRPKAYYNDYGWNIYGEVEKNKEKRNDPEYIEGYLQDGKPQGVWKMYDQSGKVLVEANFEKGELDGKVMEYAYQKPIDDDYYFYSDFDLDTFPEKTTYYLQMSTDFSKGQMHGKSTTYDWLGNIVTDQEFKDGLLDGISLQRNNVAVTRSEYKFGVLDGYSRTHLTLPGKDSILLYDLNFQNGQLQGESISYHTNGKISKRGFFLAGEPIEDYEGFDSLGFLYHYVKFEYGFPVEEKLWEENQLSVRYLFDWQDSIYFIPMNITNSESLEALLVQAGLSQGFEYQPYYGRQTIVEKSGVDYHLTKYYPNDTIARDGEVVEGKKSGFWEFFSYDGDKLYEVNYFDTLIALNDSIRFNSKGIYTGYNPKGEKTFEAFIIEKSERFDCSHKDHYEVRQFYTTWEAHDSVGRMNGTVYNYYDNGTLQSYGTMKNGLPEGAWRYYDPAGKLAKYGNYVQGKRNGRWLSGDLSKTKYLGDICLNPNMPDVEEELRFRENFLDIQIINYKLGQELHKEFYDINMNEFIQYDDEESVEDEDAPDEEMPEDH